MSESSKYFSEHLGNTPPRAWQETELDPGDLHGPFFNKEGEHVEFPDYEFSIDWTRLESSGVIETTTNSQLRYCLKLLENSCGDDFNKFKNISHPNVRASQFEAYKKFTSTKVLVDSSGTKEARRNVINTDLATNEVYKQLAKANHPVWQLFEQINTNRPDSVSSGEIQELGQLLVIVFAWPSLRQLYLEQIKTKKTGASLIEQSRSILE